MVEGPEATSESFPGAVKDLVACSGWTFFDRSREGNGAAVEGLAGGDLVNTARTATVWG